MKKQIANLCLAGFVLITSIMFWPMKLSAQWTCSFTPGPEYHLTNPGMDCDDWYHYAPHPGINTIVPMKYIRVAYHVLQDGNGQNNFQNTTQDKDFLQQIINNINWNFSSLDTLNFRVIGYEWPPEVTPYMSDCRIRAVLDTIYFHSDSLLWDFSDPVYLTNRMAAYQKYVVNNTSLNDRQKNKTMHIILGGNYDICGGFSGLIWIPMRGVYYAYTNNNPPNFWVPANVIAHEMGHNFFLDHNFHGGIHGFDCDNCTDNDPLYLPCPIEGSTNNLMDYWPGRGWALSQCQIGLMQYNLSSPNYPGASVVINNDCVLTDSVLVIKAGNHILWNFNNTIAGDLVIEPGATLEIRCTVRMKPGRRIVVERGAQLIVDGAVITAACSMPWQGIEVWGDPDKSQYPDINGIFHQGRVTITNGSTIENAIVGVLASRLIMPPPDEDNGISIPVNIDFNGGIVSAINSQFINNKTAICLPPYENKHPVSGAVRNNMSYVKNCDFMITPAYSIATAPDAFIHLAGVRGIQTIGNTFTCNIESTSFTGILSLNSSFSVTDYCLDAFLPCQNIKPSRFENMPYGIRALGAGTAKTFAVNNAEFINNRTGIYSSAIHNFSVVRSYFNVAGAGLGIAHRGGIYIENAASGFRIEENVFAGNYLPGPVQEAQSIGVAFNNTGVLSNELYNNHFNLLHVATLAMKQNRSSSGMEGLCIKCNHYNRNKQDIEVMASQANQGIAVHQGSNAPLPNAPAGNRFSWAGDENRPTDINNQGEHIYYYHHVSTIEPLEPKYHTGVTLVPNDEAPWNALSCPSNIHGGYDENTLRNMMAEAEQQAHSAQTLINALKDAGNTQTLRGKVETSPPWQGLQIYNELMAVSPYVSDVVLAKAIEKENVLVDAMLRDVLVANPHSAKSEALLDKLGQRIHPMPEPMLDEILQGQSLVSVYENLQSNLGHYRQKQAAYQKELLQHYLNDTVNASASCDNLVGLWLATTDVQSHYQAAFARHEQGNSPAAATILSNIPLAFGLSPDELEAHNDITAFVNQANALKQQEQSLFIPDSAAIAWLADRMGFGSEPAAVYSRNILLANGIVEHEPLYHFSDATKAGKIRQKPTRNRLPQTNVLKLYPNPARNFVIVAFDVSEQKTDPAQAILQFSSIEGKPLKTILLQKTTGRLVFPLTGYKQGTYLFTLYYGNRTVEIKRLSVH